jgi:hypothetical protein
MYLLIKKVRAFAVSRAVKQSYLPLILLVSVVSFAHTTPTILKIVKAKSASSIYKYAKHAMRVLKQDTKLLLTANNPPDTTITVCGSSVVLHSSTVPGYPSSSLIWDDGTTGSTLTATSSGTYWWQVTGTNVVVNGDFSGGNTGFTSAYNFMTTTSPCPGCCCGVLSNEATYGVNTNPHNLHTLFSSFVDHTSGSGKMLVVNGASVANVTVWAENIPISANTEYVFSVWATSANASNPAILQFSINGSPLGGTINISPSLADGVWQFFTATWNSGSTSGNMPIALVNQNTQANGNDFAVDDIVFAPVYRQNIIVNLNPIPVLTLTSPHTACGVYDLTKAITGYDTSTYDYFFKDASGNTITLSNAQAISQSGTYTITEQNKVTGCSSISKQTTITITPNPQKPGITSM